MKPASGALQTLLATRSFLAADLYTFTLVGGGVLRYTSFDTDVVANGFTFTSSGATGPFFDRKDNKAKAHWKIGVEVDTLVFDVLPGAATINGQPFLAACLQGVFDGAELQFERAFMPPPVMPVLPPATIPTMTGTVIIFVGRVAEVDLGRSLATFTVNSHLELLNQNMPRNLFQAPCVNTLFDAACAFGRPGMRASFAVSGAAASGSNAFAVNAGLSQATGYFDLGSIVFTSGANNGVSRSVKSYTQGSPGTLNLLTPLPNPPVTGDTFTLYPGCDKQQATCSGKFANLANFQGFPFIPIPETVV